MTKNSTILFFLSVTSILFPQWSKIEPLPIKYNLNSIFFVDNKTGYATSQYGILIKTTDSGSHWKTLGTVAENKLNSIYMLANTNGFAVGDSGTIISSSIDTISQSDLWLKQVSNTKSNLNSVYFAENNMGFVAGDMGTILRTTSGGEKWIKMTSGTTFNLKTIFFINRTQGWVAGTKNGQGIILRSTNSGENWEIQSAQITIPGLNSIYFSNKTFGWAVGNRGTILKTTNGGKNWIRQDNSLEMNLTSVKFFNEKEGIISGEKGLILTTTNGGSNWDIKYSATGYKLNCISANTSGNVWTCGDSGIIMYSSNFGNIWSKGNWVTDFTFKDIYFSNNETGWIIGGPGFIFKTTNGGISWVQQQSKTGFWLNAIQFIDNQNGWIAGKSGLEDEYNFNAGPNVNVIYKTTDGGKNWQLSKLPTVAERYNVYGIRSINFVDKDNGWISGYVSELSFPDVYPEGIIYRTTNGGKTWTCSFIDNTNNIGKIKFTDKETGWCIDGFEYEGGGELLKSTNSGNYWSTINTDLQYSSDFYFLNQEKGWLTGIDWEFQKVIYRTNNGGMNWERSELPFLYSTASIYFIDENNGWIVGREEKVNQTGSYTELILNTRDGGKTWRKQSIGIYNPLRKVFFVDKENGWAIGENGMIIKYHSTNEDLTWFSSIDICNSSGNCTKLSFGQSGNATKGIDPQLGEFELSQVPSQDIFDARFLLPGNPIIGSIQDFRDVNEQTVTWKINFQAGVNGYPVSFNFNDVPDDNFKLIDALTGNVLVQDLKLNPYVVFENPLITSLEVVYTPNHLCTDVSIQKGWNLISVPFKAENMSLESLFPLSKSKAIGFSGQLLESDTLEAGKAYYIKFDSSGNSQICGNVINIPIKVKKGWNLIGPFDKEVSPNNITSIPERIIKTPFYELKSGLSKVNLLRPGKGYFVKVKSDGYLSFNSLDTESVQQIVIAEQTIGRVDVEDQEGNTISLFDLKDNGVNTDQFELPPAPPAGVFDVRFETGMIAENLKENSKKINISSAVYPIKIKTDRINIGVKYTVHGKIIEEIVEHGKEFIISENEVKFIEVKKLSNINEPLEYTLLQNYPNPFNPETTIKFSIPEEGKVNLSIFSILGEKVAELINKELEPGYHEIRFNAAALSSGIYFYKIESGKFNAVKKMMVLK